MNSFNEVGLGFAEFVAQLLNETFDSVLSAQNYQLEKYIELENAKNLSSERFFDLYLDEDALAQRELDTFGIQLKAKMVVPSNILIILEEIFESTVGFLNKNRLTKSGYEDIQGYLKESLVEERKNLIDTLLNKTELARLVVDSGEIRAKLELSNLHDEGGDDDDKNVRSADSITMAAGAIKPKETNAPIKTPIKPPKGTTQPANPESLSDLIGKIPIKEFINPSTKEKTLIVDKKALPEGLGIKSSIPDVRVIARPVKMTTNSNLFSEVVIKFKTV